MMRSVSAHSDRARTSFLLVAVLAVAAAGSACGSHTAPRFPGAIRPPHSAPQATSAVVATAMQLEGRPYRNGGSDPTGFDCSGLVRYVFGRHGVTLPRNVRDQFQAGLAVPRSALVPGDLVFFSTTGRGATHVGIVVARDSFLHAPSERGVVRVESLSGDYWARRYVGARRILLP